MNWVRSNWLQFVQLIHGTASHVRYLLAGQNNNVANTRNNFVTPPLDMKHHRPGSSHRRCKFYLETDHKYHIPERLVACFAEQDTDTGDSGLPSCEAMEGTL
jgi:hypothetical protein